MSIRMIADACSNHNQSLDRCRRLIEKAKTDGCDAIKFQLFDDRLHDDPKVKEVLRHRALPPEFVPQIATICREVGLEFHCTPFSPNAVEILAPHVKELKVGSYEILWLDLITRCAQTRLPLGISCGGANGKEVRAAYEAAREYLPEHQITLYHCIPEYPALPDRANLISLSMLRKFFQCRVGYSDHTASRAVVTGAAALGADAIEFHLDVHDGDDDEYGRETGHGHCWPVDRVAEYVREAREASLAYAGRWCGPGVDAMRASRTDPKTGSRPIKES